MKFVKASIYWHYIHYIPQFFCLIVENIAEKPARPFRRFGRARPGRMEETRTFANIWDALEDTPEAAANMKLRSSLLIDLKAIIRANRWTPAEAAEHCGLDRANVDELLRGNVDLFPLEALVGIAARLDREVRLELLTPVSVPERAL